MTFNCPCTKTDALDALEAVGESVGCRAFDDDSPVSAAFYLSLVNHATSVAWKSDPDGYELEVTTRGNTYRFDVRMPMPETAAS